MCASQCCIELRTGRLSRAEEVFYLPDELDNFRVPDVWTEYTSAAHTGGTSRLTARHRTDLCDLYLRTVRIISD